MKNLIVGAFLSLFVGNALAAEATVVGNTVEVTGYINPGDEFKLRDAVTSKTKTIRLNSVGGNIASALQMGLFIRDHKLNTLINAKFDLCVSACGIIFVSGNERIYLNGGGENVNDGKHGLGFHQGNNGDTTQHTYDGQATADEIDAFYQLGAIHAVHMVNEADPSSMLMVDSSNALILGFATRTK